MAKQKRLKASLGPQEPPHSLTAKGTFKRFVSWFGFHCPVVKRFVLILSKMLDYYLTFFKNVMSIKFLHSVLEKCKKDFMGDKKVFSTRVDGDRIKELKHLAVDTDRSLGDLLEEALEDLLKKYEKKAK